MLKLFHHTPQFHWAAFPTIKPCLRCFEIWQGDTQSKTTLTFFFLTQIFLSQAAMFVNSLIFPPFQNSQFDQSYNLQV